MTALNKNYRCIYQLPLYIPITAVYTNYRCIYQLPLYVPMLNQSGMLTHNHVIDGVSSRCAQGLADTYTHPHAHTHTCI
jgi:hypothetical protein